METGAVALAEARGRWLEQQCLLSELQDVVDGAQHAALEHGRDQDVFGTVGSQTPTADVVASLAAHLQAAAVVQQLQLPKAQAKNPFSILHEVPTDAFSSDVADDTNDILLGSKQHVCGVTPKQLRQMSLPSRKAAQRAHATVVPVLEQRLKHHVQTAVAAITRPSPGHSASNAVQSVTDTQEAIAQLQQSNQGLLRQLQQEAAAYLGELDGIHCVLQQLVGSSMLEEQPKVDQVNREHVQASLQQCASKLNMMQRAVWNATYVAQNIEALAVISQEQQGMEQQLRSSIHQAQEELLAYTQLGDDFQAVVQEYGDIMAKIQEVDRLFDKFTELENEAAYY